MRLKEALFALSLGRVFSPEDDDDENASGAGIWLNRCQRFTRSKQEMPQISELANELVWTREDRLRAEPRKHAKPPGNKNSCAGLRDRP